MKKTLLSLALAFAILPGGFGAVALSGSGAYTQDFDSLSLTGTANAWADDSILPGWFANRVVYIGSGGTSNTGGLHSMGSGGDAALGAIGSNTAGTITFGVLFQNTGDAALELGAFSFNGEQWRNGGNDNAQTLAFSYQIASSPIALDTGASGWTDLNSFDFTSPVTGATASTVDGNTAGRAAISGDLGLTLAPGEYLMLRWVRPNSSGNDHGIGIDDLSLSYVAVPEPSAVALLAVAGVFALRRIRRRA